MRRTLTPLLLLFSFLTFSNSLQIIFRPSKVFLKSASQPSTLDSDHVPFHDDIRGWLLRRELWPLISKLSQSKTFNFARLITPVLNRINCRDKIAMLRDPDFPKFSVFTADVLATMPLCFNQFPDNFALNEKLLPFNPMESVHFRPSQWKPAFFESFIRRSWKELRAESRWSSWTADTGVAGSIYIQTDFFQNYWHVINFSSVGPLSLLNFERVVEVIDPASAMLSFSVNNAAIQPHERCEIMARTLTLCAFYFRFAQDPAWLSSVVSALKNMADTLDESVTYSKFSDSFYGLFVMLFEDEEVGARSVEAFDRNLALILQDLLEEIIQFTNVRAVWVLNVIYIWIHFAHNPAENLQGGLFPLLKVFFAEERHATAEDVCTLMRLLNTDAQDRGLRPNLSEEVANSFLISLPERLKELIYEECRVELPESFKRFQLSLTFRFHSTLRRIRRIHPPNPIDMNISLDPSTSSLFCITELFRNILAILNTPSIESSALNPMNQHVRVYDFISQRFTSIQSFKSVLGYVLYALLDFGHWFVSVGVDQIDPKRAVLVPALTLPVQFLEAIGFLMSLAVQYAIKIPFVFDLSYLKAGAMTAEECELLVYHYYRVEGLSRYPEVFLAFKYENLPSDQVFSRISTTRGEFIVEDSDEEGEDEEEKRFLQEKKRTGLDRSDLTRLMLIGLERFYSGLNEVIPIDDFAVEELYSILFKE